MPFEYDPNTGVLWETSPEGLPLNPVDQNSGTPPDTANTEYYDNPSDWERAGRPTNAIIGGTPPIGKEIKKVEIPSDEQTKQFDEKWKTKPPQSEADFNKYESDFNRFYKKLPDNSYISRSELEKVRQSDKEGFRTLTDKGLSAYNAHSQAQINADNFVTQQEAKRSDAALKVIEKYKEGDEYYLGQAVADGVTSAVLIAAHFSPDAIMQAKKEADYINASPLDKFNILKKEGKIPANATFDKANLDGSISYNLPGETKYDALTQSHVNNTSKPPISSLKQITREKGVTAAIATVWQFFTPWDEQGGQNFVDYMKGYPGRVKDTATTLFVPKSQPSQEELRAQYNAGQKLPLWAKILGAQPQIVYNSETDKYTPYVIGVAEGDKAAGLASRIGAVVKKAAALESPEVITSKSGGGERLGSKIGETQQQKLVQKIGAVPKQVKTLGPEDVGMSEVEFVKYREASQRIPGLSPQAWKDSQKVDVRKIDWAKINQSIEEGKVALAQDKNSEVFNQMLDDFKQLLAQSDEPIKMARNIPNPKSISTSPDSPTNGGAVAAYQRWLAANPFGVTKKPAPINVNVEVIKPQDVDIKQMAAVVVSTAIQEAVQAQPQKTTIPQKQDIFQRAFDTALDNQIKSLPDTTTRQKVENEVKKLTTPQNDTTNKTETFTKTITTPQLQTTNNTELQNKTETKPKTFTETQQKTSTQPQTTTKTQLQNKTETTTNPTTQTTPKLNTQTPTQPITGQITQLIPRGGYGGGGGGEGDKTKKKYKIRLPNPATNSQDETKRKAIREAGGAVAWVQGELKGQDVWHVFYYPYGKGNFTIVMGRTPEGATVVNGPGEAYKSIAVIRGKAPTRPVTLEGGAIDPTITPVDNGRRVRISFAVDTSNAKGSHRRGRKPRFGPPVERNDIGIGVIENHSGKRHIKKR